MAKIFPHADIIHQFQIHLENFSMRLKLGRKKKYPLNIHFEIYEDENGSFKK